MTVPKAGPIAEPRPPLAAARIGVAPTSPAHVWKNRRLFDGLREKGAVLQGLGLDALLPERFRCQEPLEDALGSVTVASGEGFRPRELWLLEAAQRGRLDRSLDRMLEAAGVDTLLLFSAGLVVPSRLVRRARDRGMRTILIPDGLVRAFHPGFQPAAREPLSFALRRLVYGWTPRGAGSVDRVLTIDAEGKRALVRGGIDESRIDVVGAYEYEALADACRDSHRRERELELRRRLALTGASPLLLYAHQSIHGLETTLDVVRSLARGVDGTGAIVLAKLHPAHTIDVASLRTRLERETPGGSVMILTDECTSTELIPFCTLCVTAYSTVALESLVCGVPVVLLQYLAPRFRLDYPSRYGAGVEVHEPTSLPGVVRQFLSDPGRLASLASAAAAAVEGELGPLDGRSIERTVDVVLNAAKRPVAPRAAIGHTFPADGPGKCPGTGGPHRPGEVR